VGKSLEELREVDDRTLRFTPHGLGLGMRMRPEDSARYLQAVVAQFELVPAVVEGTRMSFDRLRTVFVRGLFCYDLFTLVNDGALLVIEQALRDRFIDYHAGTVRFRDVAGQERTVMAVRYDDVHDAVRKNSKWRLMIDEGREPIRFNGMLDGLRTWARAVGLLRGQRNRGIERALSNLRNFVAHPTSYHLVDPWGAARTLSDLAEIINHLWGSATPGGRLYPAPIRREVMALAWSDEGDSFVVDLADGLLSAVEPEGSPWQYVIVRAVSESERWSGSPGLSCLDSRYEFTQFPVDPLWGPGALATARDWWEANGPAGDECEYLDRTFAVRLDDDQLYWPMHPAIAGTIASEDRAGTWYIMRADFPADAYHHVRTLLTGTGCTSQNACEQCPAETLAIGPYADLRIYLPAPSSGADPVPDFRTPRAAPRSRAIGT
jgi:hypothetical protein